MIVLRNNYFSKTNLGGDYVEFIDEKGYLNNKSGKVKKLSAKNLINLVKRNPKTSAAVLTGATLVGTGAGVGRHLYKKNKQKTYSEEDNKGMGLGAKLAIGAGTAAAAFAGARRGMFGAKAAMGANKAFAGLGRKLGNRSMVSDATRRMIPTNVHAPMKNANIVNQGAPLQSAQNNTLDKLTDIKGGLNLMK